MTATYPGERLAKAACLAAAASLALTAASASAARQPTHTESSAIATAVRGFLGDWYYAGSTAPATTATTIRISTANPDWASALVSAPAAHGRPALARVTLLLWRATGSPGAAGPSGRPAPRRWVVVSPRFSVEYSWCGLAPVAVTRDLAPNLGC